MEVLAEATPSRSAVSRAEILRSAREEIENKGILGLRVAEVAAGANCSLTQIYRYFGDRDGLLAQVLGDYYEEVLDYSYSQFMRRMKAIPQISIEDLIQNLPTPTQYAAMSRQEIRLQILAVAGKNPQLRQRLMEVTQRHADLWDEGLTYIEEHLEPGLEIDRRVFTIMLLLQTMYYRTLLGDKGFTDEEYRQFLRDMLRKNKA